MMCWWRITSEKAIVGGRGVLVENQASEGQLRGEGLAR